MLKLFLDRSRGSITVMVTLMLIPTIFFTGFLTDLARIKLSSNQAVMVADNYGEAILTEYDYLLKELYGLFAISQNEEGMKAIEELQGYMQTSFDPTSNAITWDHLAGWTGFLSGDFEGCMPYKNANINLEYQLVENSALSFPEVFSTQVGDFMRFRIVQEFMDSDVQDMLLDALEQGQNAEKDSIVLDAKTDFDDAVSKLMESMKNYYDVLKRINHYPDYIRNINTAYGIAKREFSDIVDSDSYKKYREYIDHKEEIEAVLDKKEEDRTEDDQELLKIKEEYDNDPDARMGKLLDRFENAVDKYVKNKDDSTIDFASFDSLANDLNKKAEDVKSKMETAKVQRDKLEASLEEGVTEELKKGIKDSIKIFDDLVSSDYSSQCYIDLAKKVSDNKTINSDYELQMMNQKYQLEQIRSEYVEDPAVDKISEYKDELDLGQYDDFQKNLKYNTLYQKLNKMFEDNNSRQEEQAKSQRDEANKKRKEAEDELNKSETTEARSIPDTIDIGDRGKGGGASITDLIKSAAGYFKMNSFGEAGNKLLLKFYIAAYDYGMFSNRVTNVEKESESKLDEKTQEEAVSLTGMKMCKSVNYLYQAEMEYIYGGHKNSVDNLNAAKNSIVAFRTVVNMTSTYTIAELDKPIRAIRDALMELPVLAIAVEAALRLGITAVETAADWSQLKKGEAVTLVKRDIRELEAFDIIKGFLPDAVKMEGETGSLKLDYNQYLLVMITFLTTSDQVVKRTGDLITLNVNAVQQEVGEDGVLSKLQFEMNKAYTAVEASCTAHIDFVVMPDSFAKKAVDDTVYSSLTEYGKNKYKFTVARGY